MSKVSVIIAAYNVEEYISKTLESAVNQTLKDIEIVVVDDFSTDSTPNIISKFAENDLRIKVVKHEENKSVNISRIDAINIASGEYVMFLDGDDMLLPDACEKAYNAITRENVDMVQFDVDILLVSGARVSKSAEQDMRADMASSTQKLISSSKAGLLDEKSTHGAVNFTIWDKIYKKELLDTAIKFVPYEYLNMAEDVLLSFLVQYHAGSYAYIPDRLYKYRFGCGMSTTKKMTERIIKAVAKNAYVYGYLCEWVRGVGAETECEQALGKIQKKLYMHIANTYVQCKSREQRELLISEALCYGNADTLLYTLSEYFYSELQGYKNSESYRIGMLITFIPRKMLLFVKRLFFKKKR